METNLASNGAETLRAQLKDKFLVNYFVPAAGESEMQCAQQKENKRTLADTERPVDVKQTCAAPSGHGSPKRHKSGQGEVNISPGSSCQATTRSASSSDNINYESGGFKISSGQV